MAAGEIVSMEPATGAEVWRGVVGDVDATVDRARRAWPAWAAQPLANRIEMMRRFANAARADADRLAILIARETGRPLWDARGEVEIVVETVEAAVRGQTERCAQRRFDSALQGSTALRHKPHGVMAVIGPFDQPAAAPAAHIIPALIAGNAVVFKPSEKAPATGEALAQYFHRAGLSAGLVQVLIGDGETGEALSGHEGCDGVLFTGSTHTGLSINRRLVGDPGRIVALKMGGNNPIVVWNTPRIADAAALVVQSAFVSSGQRCTAARRLIVRDALFGPLIAEIKQLTDRLIIGAPLDSPAPFMGPVIDNRTADGLTESFLYLLSHGGRAIRHLVRGHETLPFLAPAIIDVTAVAERPDVELFGPLLQVIRVDDFDAAIAEANTTRFGLCAALVGGTSQDYGRFWANIRAGVVNWNRATTTCAVGAPFGGAGLSGNQRAIGLHAADHCSYPVASNEQEQPRASLGVGLGNG